MKCFHMYPIWQLIANYGNEDKNNSHSNWHFLKFLWYNFHIHSYRKYVDKSPAKFNISLQTNWFTKLHLFFHHSLILLPLLLSSYIKLLIHATNLSNSASYKVSVGALLRILFFWDMMMCQWVTGSRHFEGIQCPQHQGSTCHRRILLGPTEILLINFISMHIHWFIPIFFPSNIFTLHLSTWISLLKASVSCLSSDRSSLSSPFLHQNHFSLCLAHRWQHVLSKHWQLHTKLQEVAACFFQTLVTTY